MSREVGEAAVDDILAHFGVKGMKWGVRRKATVGPQEVFVRPSKFPGSKRLKTTGGRGHPATKEATDARVIGQIGKKSGVHSLSDQQLQQYAKRIQLEENVKRLQYTQLNPGQKFVKTMTGQSRQSALDAGNKASTAGGKRAVGYALKKAAKKGGKVGAAAALV